MLHFVILILTACLVGLVIGMVIAIIKAIWMVMIIRGGGDKSPFPVWKGFDWPYEAEEDFARRRSRRPKKD